MQETKYLTKKELREELSCPGYVIDYLNDCGRLPIIRESRGRGFPILYHPDSVKVIRDHISKQINA